MKTITTIISSLIFSSISAIAGCPPCVCTESISPSKGLEYDAEIIKVTSEKVTPKINEIYEKTNKIKELQTSINEKLSSLESIEVQEFILHKKKNYELEKIVEQVSMNIDGNVLLNRAILEDIKTKINILSSRENSMKNDDVKSTIFKN